MKLELEDPYINSKSMDLIDSDEPQLAWALSPVAQKQMTRKPKQDVFKVHATRQYFGGVAFMVVALIFYFLDSVLTTCAYTYNSSIAPFEVVLIKALVGFLIYLVTSHWLDVNVFKFNVQFNISLDNEEITDTKTMKLCFITAITGSIAMILQANALKYIPDIISNIAVSCNSILIFVSLPIFVRVSFKNTSKYDFYSTIILLITFGILIFGNLQAIDKISSNLLGYTCSGLSAVFFAISMILLRELNKWTHFIYYCVYFSLGYLVIWLFAYTISSQLFDLSKVKIQDFTASLLAGVWEAVFIILVSLAHKYAKPSQLAPMWSLVAILSIIHTTYSTENYSLSLLLGGFSAFLALVFPIVARILKDDPTLLPENQIHLLRRFSSF